MPKLSGAEIVILNVIEDIEKYTPTAILATMKGQAATVSEKGKSNLEITMELVCALASYLVSLFIEGMMIREEFYLDSNDIKCI